jgi:transketolase
MAAGSVKEQTATRKAFTGEIERLATDNDRICVVTSDAKGSVTLKEFEKHLPNQFVEVGIAEQNAVGIGAGLANSGRTVFVCGPACFYSARAVEQVKNDVAYAGSNVIIVAVSGGVAYGALGSTHHSLHDIAVYRAIPEVQIVLPSDARQTEWATRALAERGGPAYMRLGRNPVPDIYTEETPEFRLGKAHRIREGSDISIVASGETVHHALAAADTLASEGIQADLLDLHTIKPFDREAVLASASRTGAVVTVEEHSVYGGLGAAVAEVLSQQLPRPMRLLGFPDEFLPAGSGPELFEHYGISAGGIAEAARELLRTGETTEH